MKGYQVTSYNKATSKIGSTEFVRAVSAPDAMAPFIMAAWAVANALDMETLPVHFKIARIR